MKKTVKRRNSVESNGDGGEKAARTEGPEVLDVTMPDGSAGTSTDRLSQNDKIDQMYEMMRSFMVDVQATKSRVAQLEATTVDKFEKLEARVRELETKPVPVFPPAPPSVSSPPAQSSNSPGFQSSNSVNPGNFVSRDENSSSNFGGNRKRV